MFFKKHNKILFIALFLILGGLLLGTGLALAQQDESSNAIDLGVTYGEQTGLGGDDIRLIIARVIRAALGLLGIIALVIMLYGGYVYMTAAGNEEKVSQAKKILINGTVGLLIILASLAIVQFIFSKLLEATLGGASENCQTEEYAQTHLLECFPGPLDQWCKEDPLLCCDVKLNEEGVFFAKSITPVSEDTRMNNVAGRSILSQPINSKFAADKVLSVKQGDKDITNQFDFSFISNDKGGHVGVEARYKSGFGLCSDGKTPCLENGKYNLEINKDLTSQSGKKIMEVANKECQFPLSADFTIAHKNKLVLSFDGKDDYVAVGQNPLENGDMTIEAWIYPTSKEKGFVMAVDSERYYILSQNGFLRFRLAGQHAKNQNGAVTEWHYCDKFAYGVPINKWSHVVATYNDETKEQSVYVNGILNTNPSGPAKFNDCGSISGGQLEIGRDLVAIGQLYEPWHFPGMISGMCLYNESLDDATVKAHFAQGLGACGEPGNNGLVAGWHLDEAWPDKVVDFTGNKHDGVFFGDPVWQLSPHVFQANKKVKDIVAPFADKIKVNDNIADEEDIYNSGGAYNVNANLTDNSGIGYGSIKIERETKSKGKESVADSFNGPAVKRQGGSDALPDNPYNLNYILAVGQDLKEIAKYTVNMKAYDIDQNFTSASASFIVQPKACEENPTAEGCGGQPGDSCLADWQCGCGKCVKEKCVAQPKISSIDPLKGAEGNYVTIVGKCFGANKGTVEFGYDSDKDNKITELDKWVDAKVVECGSVKCGMKTSWYNTWIVVEVPPDVGLPPNAGLPQSSTSSIKVKHNDSTKDNPLLDYSTDGFGPILGLFEKDNVKRPGLCSVTVAEDEQKCATIASPKTKVNAAGSGFGNSGAIFFGGVQAQYTAWTDKLIDSRVPSAMKEGVVAVYVTSTESGQPSNSVPFTIKNAEDLAKDIPAIDQIDPPSTTPKSWITIYGHGFGPLPGMVYLADSAEHAKDCAQGKEGVVCASLDLELPKECGNTWSDTQVIAAVPENIAIKKYFLILKNVSGLYTDGEDNLEVKSGNPMPGLCKLEPDFGPAPLPRNDYLKLYGVNFSNKVAEDNVYFWQNKADINNVGTWLKATNEINSVLSDKIETAIPLDGKGLSMQTGPIKVGVKSGDVELLSNSVKYEVADCRKADAELVKKLEGQGMQCCAKDGLEAGQWKFSIFVCAGESREAGYVWRFTTGKIHQLPKVVEQCREIDWDNPQAAVEYPSPVPSDLWKKGKETCLNATVAVRFTVSMDDKILLAKDDKSGKFVNVKVFTCSDGDKDKPDCSKKSEVSMGESDMSMFGPNILEIRKGSSDNLLKPNTWYHVELSDKIVSADCGEIGLATCYKDNLQKTKPCGDGTAYCFDFKTGDEENLCTVKNASIAPPSYTVHLLGLVLNPAHPFDSQPPHPYFYFVWGRGSQECVVLNVDGMGWEWSSKDDTKAMIVVSPTKAGEKPAYIDSRAETTALQNAPEGVELDASLDKVIGKETINILEKFTGSAKPVMISSSTGDIFSIASFAGEKWELGEYYTVKVSYGLDEIVSTSTMMKKPYLTEDKKIGFFWELPRYIYANGSANKIYVVDKVYDNGKKERGFVYEGAVKLAHWQTFDKSKAGEWGNGMYTVKKGLLETALYFGGEDGLVVATSTNKTIQDIDLIWKGAAYLGGLSKDAVGSYPLIGKVNHLVVDKTSYLNQSIKAISTLFIDLFDPEVVKFWPNCLAACVNTGVGVKFNMPMFEPDYNGAIEIYECQDGEQCLDKMPVGWNSDVSTSNEYVLRALPKDPADFLAPDTWYLVTVNKGVRALNKLNTKEPPGLADAGKPMKEDFIWKFRTKNDDTPCVVSSVNVLPNPFLATIIWQKTKYTASPISSPDACSPDGQELNPWLYGWEWASSDESVATVTNFSAITKGSTFCGLDCLKSGSDVSKKDNVPYLCGNDELEPGEDCEISGEGENPPVSCNFNCLRPGNLKFSTSTEPGNCGNGDVEEELGEECDVGDKKHGKYCEKNCVWAGSLKEIPANAEYASTTPICGSGTVTDGEDCDLAISDALTQESQFGCSSKCLHLGTKLARSWCDAKGKDAPPECQKAVSVCGNNKLESGEECEPKLDNDKTCSDKCLLRNMCAVEPECNPASGGCNDDCTLAGSSLLYKTPSLCGDGVVGTGEDKDCEKGVSVNALGGNPFQVVTAIGKGKVDEETKTQQADISATAGTYLKKGKDNAFDVVKLDALKQKTGLGEYSLKCGNTEYNKPQPEGDKLRYNDCQLGESGALTEKGVASNSCCYDRTHRADEYPKSGAMGVCRNTFISVDFVNHFIDEKSLPGNLTIAIGYSRSLPNFGCYKVGAEDVSEDVIGATLSKVALERDGFWRGLWNKIKGIFVRLFGGEALADSVNPKSMIWCAGSVKAVPELHRQWSKDLSTVTTTVALYIDNLLPASSTVAVFLRGGIDGIKDGQGIGIRNPDSKKPLLNDVWFFDTGEEICKLKNVTVDPDSQLFDKPSASYEFSAITESTNGQQIQSIQGSYAWQWDWQPQDNAIFDIPWPKGSKSDKDTINIAARNLEGVLVAVANAKVTEDVDQISTVGDIFTGMTYLEAMFCENPWPPREVFPFEEGISFGKTKNVSGFVSGQQFNGSALPKVGGEYYNFRMNYCADNNLPVLKPFLFLKEGPVGSPGFNFCSVGKEACANDADCNNQLYDLIGIGQMTVAAGQGVCWQNKNGPAVGNIPLSCGKASDCTGSMVKSKFFPVAHQDYNEVKRVVGDKTYVYAIVNSLMNPKVDGLVIFDVAKGGLEFWDQIVKVKDVFVYGHNLFIIDADEKEMLIYDVSNTKFLTLKGAYGGFGGIAPELVYVADGMAYVVGETIPGKYGMQAISVVDPTKPVLIKEYTSVSGKPVDLQINDKYLYVLDAENWKVDVTDISKPILAPKKMELTQDNFTSFLQLTGLEVTTDRIYVTSKYKLPSSPLGRLYAFKKQNLDSDSNLEAALSASFINLIGKPSDAHAVGNVVYMPVGSYGLIAVNAGGEEMYSIDDDYDPAPPVVISDAVIDGQTAILADSTSGTITVLDISSTQKNLYCNKDISQFKDVCKTQDWALPFLTKTLSDKTLKRFMFMNDQNDDIIGAQIFKNESRASAADWLNRNFGQVAGMKTAKVGGYDAVTDGNNYYINALNEASEAVGKEIYNNIYQFSINKDAQQSTRQVFDKLVKSLKFNINISDFGYCLQEGIVPPDKLPVVSKQDSYTGVPCANDFDCHDLSGLPKEGTNGVCSNAKTKLLRDWARLPTYQLMQSNFEKYYDDNGKYPDLKSGTYIPGYTVSMWSSWGKFSDITNNSGIKLPTDKINKWVGCLDSKADPQTCWNAASSTFYCPQFASVYEYEFVSSTKSGISSYMFHGPLEYFALSSDVAKAFINTDYFTTERGCTPLAVYSPFGEKCGDGVVNVGEECDPPGKTVTTNQITFGDKTGVCLPNYQASKTCTNGCKWEYSTCKPTVECGNGKIEGFEECDDGTLNGTYGHCASDKSYLNPNHPEYACQKQHPQFCGNEDIDEDEKTGKPLEVCDKAMPVFQWGYCDGNEIKVCKVDNECDSNKCLSLDDSSYDAKKIRSCAWDCQNYGEYCGDGKVKVEYEECDDGNNKSIDGCSLDCKKENMACKNYPAQFSTSTAHTSVFVTKPGETKEIVIDECKSTGAQICRAYGLSCFTVEKRVLAPIAADILNTEWMNISGGDSCDFDISGYIPKEYEYVKLGEVKVICSGEYKGPPAEPPPTQQMIETCGNGKKKTYKDDAGKDVVEACDMGAQNGVKCTPSYGKACTYCSSDCFEVLTVDPVKYCGNGVIDQTFFDTFPHFEECEIKKSGNDSEEIWGFDSYNFQTLNPNTSQRICSDKGSWNCDNCKLANNCVACGLKLVATGGAIPKIALANPMIANNKPWPDTASTTYVALYRTDLKKFVNPWLGFTNTFKYVVDPTKWHNLFLNTSNLPNMTTGTESNVLCDGEYGLYFNHRRIIEKLGEVWDGSQSFYNWGEANVKKYGDIFQYPVNGEEDNIENEIIMSPAVAPGIFRVVTRWTDKEGGAIFGGNALSKSFAYAIDYMTPKYTEKGYCTKMELSPLDYWVPESCSSFSSNSGVLDDGVVKIHKIVSLEKTHAQAMTIDTNQQIGGNSIAFFVSALDEPIWKYRYSNLQVEVYTFHNDQISKFSIYGPTTTSTITTAAETSTNASAMYWHVFNLVYNTNDGKYEVIPVEKILTSSCEVQKNMPEYPNLVCGL